MAVQTFVRPYDYDPSQTKEVVVGEPHTIPAAAPYEVYLVHVPRQQTPSTVDISGASTTWTEVATPPSASGQYRVRYDEALGRIEFHASDAGKAITVNYNACGTVIWAEDSDDGRPNTAEMQEVLERVQEASGIDYDAPSGGFTHVAAALDALVGVRIVEMGENANGEYVRWENGLQVCLQALSVPGDGWTQSAPGYYYSPIVSSTWPAAFVDIPFTAASVLDAQIGTRASWQTLVDPRVAGITALGLAARGTHTSSVSVHVLAIGRWR